MVNNLLIFLPILHLKLFSKNNVEFKVSIDITGYKRNLRIFKTNLSNSLGLIKILRLTGWESKLKIHICILSFDSDQIILLIMISMMTPREEKYKY